MERVLRQEDFAAYVGQSFRFRGWHGTLRLAVLDTMSVPGYPVAARQPFSLLFHGPRGDVMPQGLYAATAEAGAQFEFHIMPIHTPAPDRQEYQAAFC